MPKQSSAGVESSPASQSCQQQPQQGSSSRRERKADKKATSTTLSVAPAFLEDYLYYNHEGSEQEPAENDRQDRRFGLFRNRLFSTFVGVSAAAKIDVEQRRESSSSSSPSNKVRQKRRTSSRLNSIDSNGRVEDDYYEDVDGGYAWVVLIVMFVINASTFGTARAYGLIFENSARQGDQSRSDAALPFTIMGAIENMAGPLTGYLLARTGSWRVVVFVGSCLITLSHLLAAYFDSQSGQVLTIGLMCGVGQSFISISSFQINNAYFVRYRSRAFGIGLTGAAVGTFYISPLCQFLLDNYTRSLCYLMLGFILLPNVPLSLLLKPKETIVRLALGSADITANANLDNDGEMSPGAAKKSLACSPEVEAATHLTEALASVAEAEAVQSSSQASDQVISKKPTVFSISNELMLGQTEKEKKAAAAKGEGFWAKVGQVLATPVFHLIWTTQLLFCWLNFVFGMIITDFGKDRGLNETQNSHLIVIWASGQLFGRLCLGSLVDLRILSYKSFTMVCFASISMITFVLNNFSTAIDTDEEAQGELASNLICLLVFILSMFISTLYILFNGLVVNYMDKSLTALSIGISSFTGSFFLLPRASIIGYYRDTSGNYDSMLTMFTWVTMISALVWLIVPWLCTYARSLSQQAASNRRSVSYVNDLLNDCSLSTHTISNEWRPDVIRQN